ncbi:MAG: hypothetical protein U5L11_14215 [Arhodomonas sp.]|nr:hypothetical protein [Arhodomonas sp.]
MLQGVQAIVARGAQARQARERPGLSAADVAEEGRRILEGQGVELEREPHRDLFAALVFTVACLGRGWRELDPASAGMGQPDTAAGHALADDVCTAGGQLRQWLGGAPEAEDPTAILGVMQQLAAAFAAKVDGPTRAEALLSLDDACLAAGPRTLLQDGMIDILAETLGVEVALEGES